MLRNIEEAKIEARNTLLKREKKEFRLQQAKQKMEEQKSLETKRSAVMRDKTARKTQKDAQIEKVKSMKLSIAQ